MSHGHGRSYIKNIWVVLLRWRLSEGGVIHPGTSDFQPKISRRKACFSCFRNFTFLDKWHQQWAFAWLGREGPFILIRTNIAIREIEGLSYLSHSSLVFLGQKITFDQSPEADKSTAETRGLHHFKEGYFWGGAARSNSIWDELLATRDHTVCAEWEWKWSLMVIPKHQGCCFSLFILQGALLTSHYWFQIPWDCAQPDSDVSIITYEMI